MDHVAELRRLACAMVTALATVLTEANSPALA